MVERGDAVVVAVSGGPDSVACLHALLDLKEYELGITVAHFNHGLRGKEAQRDAEFTEELAARLGLEFEYGEGDTTRYSLKSKLSMEEAARDLRYEFIDGVRKKHRARWIATGHTLNDQAETVLMRLLRGSGLRGLAAMRPVGGGAREGVIRPLIEVSRLRILDYLKHKKEVWIEDSTNLKADFLRNRIRLHVMPLLERLNPSLNYTLGKTASILRLTSEFMENEARARFVDVFPGEIQSLRGGEKGVDEMGGGTAGGGEFIGDVRALRALHGALRYEVLRLAIKKVKGDLRRIAFDHVDAVDTFLIGPKVSGEIDLPADIIAAKGYGLFVIMKDGLKPQDYAHRIPSPGSWSFPEVECDVGEGGEGIDVSNDPFTAFLDGSRVRFPIEVRNFGEGDRGIRFQPLGMEHHKTLKRFMVDSKVPRFLRSRIPVFMSGGEVMWVGGLRVDERFKLDGGEKGKGAIIIRLKRPVYHFSGGVYKVGIKREAD